jgi:hypothetical protein
LRQQPGKGLHGKRRRAGTARKQGAEAYRSTWRNAAASHRPPLRVRPLADF